MTRPILAILVQFLALAMTGLGMAQCPTGQIGQKGDSNRDYSINSQGSGACSVEGGPFFVHAGVVAKVLLPGLMVNTYRTLDPFAAVIWVRALFNSPTATSLSTPTNQTHLDPATAEVLADGTQPGLFSHILRTGSQGSLNLAVAIGPSMVSSDHGYVMIHFSPTSPDGFYISQSLGVNWVGSSLAQVIPALDDSTHLVVLPVLFGSQSYVRFCGTTYTSFWVNSNGNVTFGAGSTEFNETAAGFLTSPHPRIAACWDDLNPAANGQVSVQMSHASGALGSVRSEICWRAVPEWGTNGSANTFKIDIEFNLPSIGMLVPSIEFVFGDMTLQDGLVGLSPGSSIGTGALMNFSGIGLAGQSISQTPTPRAPYEIFGPSHGPLGLPWPFDLANRLVRFDLDSNGWPIHVWTWSAYHNL